MALSDPLATILTVTGSVAGIGATIHYGSKAIVRVVAGIAAIAAKDPKRSRAERALAVLRELRGDSQPPPTAGATSVLDATIQEISDRSRGHAP